MMEKALVGAATRYIAGRNAVQTVYWRSAGQEASPRMLKVSRTCNFGKAESTMSPPTHLKKENNVRFN